MCTYRYKIARELILVSEIPLAGSSTVEGNDDEDSVSNNQLFLGRNIRMEVKDTLEQKAKQQEKELQQRTDERAARYLYSFIDVLRYARSTILSYTCPFTYV